MRISCLKILGKSKKKSRAKFFKNIASVEYATYIKFFYLYIYLHTFIIKNVYAYICSINVYPILAKIIFTIVLNINHI